MKRLLLIILLSNIYFVNAQQTSYVKIQLKNGSIWKSNEYHFNATLDSIEIMMLGKAFKFAISDIDLVESFTATDLSNRKYSNDISLGFLMNQSGLGISVKNAHYFKFHRLAQVGLGFGLDVYNYPLFPVYFTTKGKLLKSKITPIYTLNSGYGFALLDRSSWRNSKGGYYFNGSVGLQNYSRKSISTYYLLGYQYQKETLTNNPDWGNSSTTILEYNRVYFAIGVAF